MNRAAQLLLRSGAQLQERALQGVWFAGGIAGKTVLFWGDSTTSNATKLFSELTWHQSTGEVLEGTTVTNAGENGASLYSAINDALTWNLNAVIAAAPNMVVMSWLLNDVRLGACSQVQANDRLATAISTLRAALPECEVLLWTPLTMLSDDPGSTGSVSPLSSVQFYADMVRKAYLHASIRWPHVAVVDTQKRISGLVSRLSANNPYMTDILHPNAAGNQLIADSIVAQIGYAAPLDLAAAAAARVANYAADYTVYARAVEDPNYYTLIATGRWVAQGSTYIYFSWPAARRNEIAKGVDRLVVGKGATPWLIPLTGGITTSGDNTALNALGAGNPPTVITSGTVNVYRHRYAGSAAAETYWSDTNYPYKWRGIIVSATNGSFVVGAMPGEKLGKDRTATIAADTIIVEGESPLVLTGFTFAANGDNRWFIKAGTDFSSLNGKRCIVFGNHAYEDASTQWIGGGGGLDYVQAN